MLAVIIEQTFHDVRQSVVCATSENPELISHKVFLKSFCKGQSPHKSVNVFFILVIVKDKLTGLWGS